MEDKKQGRLVSIMLVIAFVISIAVFAGAAFACKRLLAEYIKNEDLRTAVSFLIAAAVTLAVLYAVKMINRRMTKDT